MGETMTELAAGREMDAQVAIRVMGWTEWRSPVVPRGRAEADCWRTGDPHSPTVRIRDWSPSTDVATAFDVLATIGGVVQITRSGTGSGEWSVHIGRRAWWGETLPLAICRAVLSVAAREGTETGGEGR